MMSRYNPQEVGGSVGFVGNIPIPVNSKPDIFHTGQMVDRKSVV